MKKLIFFIYVGLAITSCSTSTQDKSEKSVKSFLKENLKNPSTYEPLKFSVADTVFQSDTLKARLDYLVRWHSNLVEFRRSDSSMLDYYKKYDKPRYQEQLEYINIKGKRIDSLNQSIENIKNEITSPDVQANLVEYRLTHDYRHKGLDDELVDLKIDFTLDKDFNVKKKKLQKGINGRANFDIKILSKNGSRHYIEFVIDPKFDDQIINSDGTTDLNVKAGKHYLTWTASNKNGFGVLTNPETFRKEIILEDSENTNTYFVINGKIYWTYKSIDEAEKNDYYVKYIVGK